MTDLRPLTWSAKMFAVRRLLHTFCAQGGGGGGGGGGSPVVFWYIDMMLLH